ncbi:MAG: holin [Clostridiales bacterium]|nr:holin [Clostridiales bacterium]
MQHRLKSWALWTAMGALISFCLKEFFSLDLDETVDGLLNVLLPVLAGFGIVNNPTNSSGL